MTLSPHHKSASTLFSALLLAGVCFGQSNERVSVDSSGIEGNEWSDTVAISADGRFVAFQSPANNLVPGDTTPRTDIFVHDRLTGVTERVSVSSAGISGNRDSVRASISADGRFIAFESPSDNLVPGDSNGLQDIFVHDRQTGITEHASVSSAGVGGNLEGCNASISADGRYVAFHGHSDNLVSGDTNGKRDAFVHDRQTGITERISVSSLGGEGNNPSGDASISADGRYVAFQSSASNLVPGDTNGVKDIFVHDRQTGVTERVSLSSSGTEGNDWSYEASISADGRFVAYSSQADNLVPGDTNAHRDAFIHDRQTGLTERVSVDSLGVEGNHWSFNVAVSGDGRHVAFESLANNLVPGDTNGQGDIFVHDRLSGITERASVGPVGSGGQSVSTLAAISADGRFVAYSSWAENLVSGDGNGQSDAFVYDRWSGMGQNSIFLTGPATAAAGASVQFDWQATRGDAQYWLAFAKHASGSVIDGHNFDLATPMTIIATGMNSANGLGSFHSAPVPPRAAGHTLYFEVAVRDANGVLYDSNVHAVMFN